MRKTLMSHVGYIPMMHTGFAQHYRGPVFEAEGGAGDPPATTTTATTPPAQSSPSDAEAKLLREVMEQKAALKAAKEEAASLKAQFEGIDPKAVKEMLAAQKQAEEDKLKAAGDFDKLRERMAQEHQRELEAERQKAAAEAAKAAEKDKTIRELTVGSAFLGSKFLIEDTVLPPDIARVAYDSYFEVENGRVVAYDGPRGTSSRAPLVNGAGDPLPFDEAFKRIVEKAANKDKILRSKQVSGAGTTTTNVTNTQSNTSGGGTKFGEAGYDPISKIAANLGKMGKK